MPGKIVLRFELFLQAPLPQVFRAFTNRIGFEEWLCDSASVRPLPGGRVYLAWNTGYASSGHFVKIDPQKQVAFTWRGPQDPAETLVTVKFKREGQGTALKLVHTGIWEGKKWAAAEQEIKTGWVAALRNLSAVLESGPDPRITTRPMLGIYLGDPDPRLIKSTGAPVDYGVRLEGVIEGLGAQKCGLQKNDVLVEIEGAAIHALENLSGVMAGRKAGEVLKVSFCRGSELKHTTMELTPRKTFPIPASAAALAAEVRASYAATDAQLFPYLASLTEEAASRQPAEKEWSVKQILAHLIHCERDLQAIILKSILSESTDFSDNIPSRIQATLRAYPSLAELSGAFKRAEAETLAFIDALPEEFAARKSSFWVLANALLGFNEHTVEHFDQIKKTAKP